MKKQFSLIIGICFLLLACSAPSTEKAKEEILAADKAMCALAAKEGFNKALSQYADSAFVKFTGEHDPLIGKKAFDASNSDEAGSKTIVWSPEQVVVSSSCDLGYTWGKWKFSLPDTVFYGNYFTAWKKQGDGSWKMLLDGGSETKAPKNLK